MQKIIFILCAIVCVYTMSCRNNPNLNINKKQYVVNVPFGWQETDTSIQGVNIHFMFAPKDSSNFPSKMSIMNESMQGYSLDDLVKASLNHMQSLSFYKELEQGDFETDSHVKAKWVHYLCTADGYNLKNVIYIIPIDGIIYELTGTSTVGNFDKYRKDFDAIAKSFHLK
jgi:hypothetical protein